MSEKSQSSDTSTPNLVVADQSDRDYAFHTPETHSRVVSTGLSELKSTAPSGVVSTRVRRAPQIFQSALFIILFFAATVLTVMGTLYSLSSDPERARLAYTILLFNLPLVIFLGFYLIYRVWTVLFSKKRRLSAPLLHRRFVLIFSLAALTPAILVGAFSTSLISRNINDLFGENVRSSMSQAREFLNSYRIDEFRELGKDMQVAQRVLNSNRTLMDNRITFTVNLLRLARSRGFDAVYVLDSQGMVLSRVESGRAPEFRAPTSDVFSQLDLAGRPAFRSRNDIDFLIGLAKLEAYEDAYLYVGQFLRSNSPVLSSLDGIDNASFALDVYNDNQSLLNRIFFLTFIESALLVLFAAIWLGFLLANRIILPLGRLVDAAERVRGGDLTARVSVEGDWGEMSDLGGAFNRMTRQLSSQRDDLIREHDISEQRRQFSEAVLSGVRAGVIGLSQEGKISLLNESAERLLGMSARRLIGQPIDKVLSEFSPAFRAARENISATAEDQVNFQSYSGVRNFDLRVSAYLGDRKDTGWVLTFDDMTRLVTAQRHSAWREVARRIAHEIKNPLTPIQLAAERLERKYKSEVISDPKTFENCTQTIIRQVNSLEKMVDEFSTFARTPTPVIEKVELRTLLEDILFAQGVAYPEMKFSFDDSDTLGPDAMVLCDERLISQALTNIYKNAAESIKRRIDTMGLVDLGGQIDTLVEIIDDSVIISIVDNGMGWPLSDKTRLLEPYVTTRESGTGLGLAIVKRIAEDHGGDLVLCERADGQSGARLQLYLPYAGPDMHLQPDWNNEQTPSQTRQPTQSLKQVDQQKWTLPDEI